jgi:rubrerythrin
MNIYDRVIQLEKETEKYYLELFNKCKSSPGISHILSMLANDEKKIILAYENMKLLDSGRSIDISCDTDTCMKDTKQIFEKFKHGTENFDCSIAQISLYQSSLEKQKEIVKILKEELKASTDPERAKIIEKLTREKIKHVLILETLVEMLLHTEQWVENAEFNHFDEY